jgi:long-chain acyl-CoA synthetase
MTEMGSIVTALAAEDHVSDGGAHLNSVGRAIRGASVKVMRENGSECAPGESGEIYVRGPGMMKEYYKQPELTKKSFADGWYKTKDMGYIDGYGYLNLCGRADDLIISGGENIYPGEITNVIMRLCGDVAEVAVYGVPDEVWGEHVKASVVLMPGSELTEEQLKAYCRANMPTFRAPKEIEFLPELPKNATGKIVIKALQQRGCSGS